MNVRKQIKATEFVVDGIKFSVRPFPAMTSVDILGDVLGLISPIIGTVGESVMNSEKKDLESMLGEIPVDNIVSKFNQLNGKTLQKLFVTLLIESQNVYFHDPDEPNIDRYEKLDMNSFNELFCQSLDTAIVLCGCVLKLNFSSFFTKLSTRYGKVSGVASVQQGMNTTASLI